MLYVVNCENCHQHRNCAFEGDCGRSNKPARVLLVGTHPDVPTVACRKNVVGEYASQDADRLVGKILSEFGNVFNIHAHAFIIDANAAANTPSMKAFKAALSDFKTEIIDVSLIRLLEISFFQTYYCYNQKQISIEYLYCIIYYFL